MKLYLSFLILLVTGIALAANIGDDKLNLGDGNNSATDKEIIFNDGAAAASRKKLSIDGTTKALKSNSNAFELGDDTAGNKSLKVKRGGNVPEIRFNTTTNKWESSEDGAVYKAFGTGSGGGGDGGINLLTNAGFEDGTSPWVTSGGTFTTPSYTTPDANNTKYASFVASGSGQYLESPLVATPSTFGAGCMAEISYSASIGNSFKLLVLDSTAAILSTVNLGAYSGIGYTKAIITFPCPATPGTGKLRVESLLAGTILLDNTYYGSNKNIVSISQASLVAKIDWVGTQSITHSVRTKLTFSTPSFSRLEGMTWDSGNSRLVANRPGDYQVAFDWEQTIVLDGSLEREKVAYIYKNGVLIPNAVGSDLPGIAGSNSQNESLGVASITRVITLAPGDYLEFYAFQANGLGTTRTTKNASLNIIKFPSDSQLAITSEQSGWFIDANIGGGNSALATVDVASYTEITNPSLDMVLNPGSASAKIACTGTNPSTGLTCTGGTTVESIGINFSPPYSGYFDVCSSHTLDTQIPAGTSTFIAFQLVETTPSTQTIVQEGKERKGFHLSPGTTAMSLEIPEATCGTFYFNSTAERTIRMEYEQDVSSASIASYVIADRSGAIGQRDIRMTVRPSIMNIARPVLTGDQVTSKGATNPKLCSFKFNGGTDTTVCSTATCTLQSSVGSCVSTVNRVSAGIYTVNFNTSFWADTGYTCARNKTTYAGSANVARNDILQSNRLQNSISIANNASGVGEDAAFEFMCMGQ